ncbi:hypothetical protein Ga0123462_1197 [Mariprofundus ferrinatatus]|uniref:Late embryogenesis abundant protein n=1 Tax=Mariprofundus ferrinatatus TaxID=1921087 RepID=A0A2K8L868_9PROT|nr:LEA type 2 family protein [Mariprofundus ferrinatatus]ATX82061.1 hypothetical protein Ga0123462_1197 [Mariprofundus ferrinatatus]
MAPISRLPIISMFLASLFLASCATMQHVSELSNVKFTLDRVSDVRIAGIDVMNFSDAQQLNVYQVGRITLATARENLPLDITLHLKTENPVINQVAATLTRMEWTLMLDGRDTISGVLQDQITLQAGETSDIPLRLSLNMFQFFDEKNALDMLDLALAFAGEGGGIPQGVALKIRPTINTIFGPFTYKPILIEPRPKERSQRRTF